MSEDSKREAPTRELTPAEDASAPLSPVDTLTLALEHMASDSAEITMEWERESGVLPGQALPSGGEAPEEWWAAIASSAWLVEVPVLVVSAALSDDTRAPLAELGLPDSPATPVPPEELVSAIKNF